MKNTGTAADQKLCRCLFIVKFSPQPVYLSGVSGSGETAPGEYLKGITIMHGIELVMPFKNGCVRVNSLQSFVKHEKRLPVCQEGEFFRKILKVGLELWRKTVYNGK